MYKLSMATLRKSKVGKHTYWQIVESKRVNGKPRPLVLIHLGTAEQLLYKLKEEPLKWKIKSASHGAVYFLYQIARILNLPYIFNSNFPSQKRDGLTTGETLLIGAIHRSIKPSSKRSFSDWAKTTTLPEIISFEPDKIDSQHFWNQMDMVTEEQMVEAEKQITRKMINLSLIKPELLFYDLT